MGNLPCIPSIEELVPPTANQIGAAPDVVIAEKVDDEEEIASGGGEAMSKEEAKLKADVVASGQEDALLENLLGDIEQHANFIGDAIGKFDPFGLNRPSNPKERMPGFFGLPLGNDSSNDDRADAAEEPAAEEEVKDPSLEAAPFQIPGLKLGW